MPSRKRVGVDTSSDVACAAHPTHASAYGRCAALPVKGGRSTRPSQRFLKAGLRFSAKAAMPSFWSSVANMAWNTRRSKRRPSANVVS